MTPRYQLRRANQPSPETRKWRDRTPLIAVFLALVGAVFLARLFYIQIIKHDQYKAAAVSEQLKKFSLPAERGTISLSDGDKKLPLVLNETLYLVYADPSLISDPSKTASELQPLIGVDNNELIAKLSAKNRYQELKKKVDKATAQKIDNLKLKGIITKESRFRTYPEGVLAAQILGFVNADGEGQYGVEGYLDTELAGSPGLLKAVTDVNGVPLAGNSDNIISQPTDGTDITLTIDANMQRIAEEAIKNSVEATKSPGGSVVVMEVNTGKVKAMANWPSFNPSTYEQVQDQNLYKNRSVTDALEVGSIMKTLTISAALDQGLINPDSTYYDPGYEDIDGLKITNALNFGAGTFSIFDIIRNSMNTGAVHLLKAMGGGELNEKARTTWYDYMVNRYYFGKQSGIEQSGESGGIIPDPVEGDGLNIQYANTSFGQGMTATPLQMAAALSSVINGGTYYKPTIIAETTSVDGETIKNEPKALKSGVVSSSASQGIISLMERYAQANNREAARSGFSVGGKTGTAQIPNGNGGYREDLYNGTYAGFIGGKVPEYAIIIRVDEPKISGFAGSAAARPVFTAVANGLMDTLPLQPKQ